MRRRAIAPLLAVLLTVLGAAVAAVPAHALVSTGDGTFFWQTPQPQGNAIIDVSFADAQHVWAVGNAGTILCSTDGGTTWSVQRSGSRQDLGGVSFVTLQEGWAAGNGLFHTVNGGTTWTRVQPVGSGQLDGIEFADPQHGWAWGGGNVLRTADGGDTWQLASPARGGYLVAGSFVNDRYGYVARQDGLVYRTTDGGAHWARLTDLIVGDPMRDIDLVSMSFGDRLHGLATLENAMSGKTRIMRTTDGGRTWRVAVELPDAGWAGVRFTNALDVWAACNGGAGSGSASLILHSTDAGATWSRHVVGRTNVWSIAACGDSVCAFGSEVLTSGDAGRTWAMRTSGAEVFPAWIAMADTTHGWAVGTRWGEPVVGSGPFADDSAAVILHTSDGVSWREQFTDRAAGGFIKILCADKDTAWALDENNTLWHTADGGDHWAKQVSGPSNLTNDVSFASRDEGWMVYPDAGSWGSGGATMHTSDGGATWSTAHVKAKSQLLAVSFVDPLHGWLCGGESGSSILRTADGGGTWTEVTVPGDELDWIRFFDATHGWAWGWDAETNSVMLRSDDGGATWTAVSDLAGVGIENLDFSDADNGWAVGDEGLYRTTDGGAHWALTDSGLNGLYDVAALDTTHVWTAGQGIAATVDTAADTATPATLDDADGAWRRAAVTVTLSAVDIGTAGLAGTEYRIDDEPWQPLVGGSIAFAAPDDHSGDGVHTLAYRSADNAGNVESAQYCRVAIDTQPPTPIARWASTVVRGDRAALKYRVRDACPGRPTVTVTIVVRDSRGRRVSRFVAANVAVNKLRSYRFRCRLPRGEYLFFVHARDAAGNRGTTVARSRLVVR